MLNTAESNSLLFSCSSIRALIARPTALGFGFWEKSRLEEISDSFDTYHNIRPVCLHSPYSHLRTDIDFRQAHVIVLQAPWSHGRMGTHPRIWPDRLEALVDVIYTGSRSSSELARSSFNDCCGHPSTAEAPRKNHMSTLFSRDHQDESLPCHFSDEYTRFPGVGAAGPPLLPSFRTSPICTYHCTAAATTP